MKRRLHLIVLLALLLAPALALGHHISMSFSDWEFEDERATVVFRLPFADAVWMMDESLVLTQEVSIQIIVPIDDQLRARVKQWVAAELERKITLEGCSFEPGMEVRFESTNMQVEATLACAPGYLDDFALESHFLVDANRLHTSFATFNFSDRVEQCLFRSAQFKCGANVEPADSGSAPSWQARVAPWWDPIVILLAIAILAPTTRAAAWALMALVASHGLAPLALRLGLPVPSSALLHATLSATPIYAALLLIIAARGYRRAVMGAIVIGHAAALLFAMTEIVRLSPLMIGGLFMIGAGAGGNASIAFDEGEDEDRRLTSALLILVVGFGLVHGFILLGMKGGVGEGWTTSLAKVALGAAALLFLPVVIAARKKGLKLWIGLGLLSAGLMAFMARNVNLPFSTFHYENARDLLNNMVSSPDASMNFIVLCLVLAIVIGGLHALTPGHGKTIVAAYLVGTKGRTLDAVILGIIVTITHTSSVIILAIIALFASKYIMPDQMTPWLSGASGLMILVLGAYLFQSRLRNYLRHGSAAGEIVAQMREDQDHDNHDHHHHHAHDHDHHHDHCHDDGHADEHCHDHDHDHEHGHEHDHGGARVLTHSHDGVSHSHELPREVTLGSLIALGITGGIVPCPDALAVLLIAVSLNRVFFGFMVIIAFSLGLACVLIAIGIAMVKFRPFIDRFTGEGKITHLALPLFSAGLVTLLGAAMIWKAGIF